jgi:hypothetical protein
MAKNGFIEQIKTEIESLHKADATGQRATAS